MVYQCFNLRRICSSAHQLQDPVTAALDRNIQVMTDLRLPLHHIDQLLCDLLRITVHDPDPDKPFYFTKPVKKLRQFFFSVQIHSIQSRFLCNKNQFFDPFTGKLSCLIQKQFHWNTPVFAPDLWDNTIGAVLVAALCNLQIGKISSCCKYSFFTSKRRLVKSFQMVLSLTGQYLIQCLNYLFQRCCADNGIYLFNFFLDFCLIALCQAPRYDQCLKLPCFFQFSKLQDRLNALFLGIIDKAAGIDYRRICLCLIIGKGVSPLLQHAKHHFRIYQILITAKGYK